jgi:hypothetical protein
MADIQLARPLCSSAAQNHVPHLIGKKKSSVKKKPRSARPEPPNAQVATPPKTKDARKRKHT